MKGKFKYTTEFELTVFASNDFEDNLDISSASLENLKPLIPSSVDLEKNIDLLGVAFDAAVVNKFNKNQDGIDSEAAAKLVDYFIHKPTNIEHNTNIIVGHIVNAGFSDLKTKRLITSNDALSKKDPYFLSLSAVVYKTVRRDFADALIEAQDPESPNYNKISASWELGFNDYHIALGSENISEATIVTDEKEVERLSQFLSRSGGEGKTEDGTLVRRLIVGDIFPLGVGFTYNPAAEVEGVYVEGNNSIVINNDKKEPSEANKEENADDKSIKISHNNKKDVKTINDNNNIMDEKELKKQVEAILDNKLSQKAEFSHESVASISALVADKIRELNTEFVEKRKSLETEKAQAETEALETKASVEKLQKELEGAKSEIADLQSSIASRKAEELFNDRMTSVDSDFTLSDGDRVIIAKEVKSLDSTEASFEDYKVKLNSLLEHKSNAFIEKQEKEFQSKLEAAVEAKLASLESKSEPVKKEVKETSTASVDSDESAAKIEDALDKAKASEEIILNNNGDISDKEDLKSAFKKNFKQDDIQIKY